MAETRTYEMNRLLQALLLSAPPEAKIRTPASLQMQSIAALHSDLQTQKGDQTVPNRHLVLHFDINETILVGDEAGGDSREDCLNKILAKSAFCRVPQQLRGHGNSYDETKQWEPTEWWDGSPIKDTYDEDDPVPPLYTGWKWPENCVPYYRTKFKKRAKSFVDHHGSIYRSTYEEMERQLMPSSPRESPHPVLEHMIPAFFETIVQLSEKNIEYSVVLRTMGSDLPDIAQAVTLFAEGKHPDYPNFVRPELALHTSQLVKGRWTSRGDSSGDSVYQLWQDDKIVASGDDEVLDFLHSSKAVGIQDDYPFWNKNGQEPWAGKPVWSLCDASHHHILLDDNIHNIENDSIAGVRQQQCDGTFLSLPDDSIRKLQGRHLIRVPTVAPILDRWWFLSRIFDAARQNEDL